MLEDECDNKRKLSNENLYSQERETADTVSESIQFVFLKRFILKKSRNLLTNEDNWNRRKIHTRSVCNLRSVKRVFNIFGWIIEDYPVGLSDFLTEKSQANSLQKYDQDLLTFVWICMFSWNACPLSYRYLIMQLNLRFVLIPRIGQQQI